MYKTLTTSVAAIALMTGAAFAETAAEADAKVEAETAAEMETNGAEELAQDVEQAGENAAETAEEVGNDIAEGAEDAAQAAENTVEDAANAAEDTAENAAEATEEAAEDVAQSAEEMTDGDAVTADAEVEADAEASEGNEVTSTDAGISSSFNGMVVGDILGQNVTTQDGETVGEIDYIVDQPDGLAAVIGIGGFLGLGEYTVAIPLEQFSMAAESDGLMLSSWTEEELKAQPEFDETGVEGLEDDVPLDGAM